jgi:hypothetical protein
MKWAEMSVNGSLNNERLWAGMEVIVAIVNPVDVEILLLVNTHKYQVFRTMADMQIT